MFPLRFPLRTFSQLIPGFCIGDNLRLFSPILFSARALPVLRLCEPDALITDTFSIPQTMLRRQPPLRILYTFGTPQHSLLTSRTEELRQRQAGFVLKTILLERLRLAVRHIWHRANNIETPFSYAWSKRRAGDWHVGETGASK